jgi:hypothetical protein
MRLENRRRAGEGILFILNEPFGANIRLVFEDIACDVGSSSTGGSEYNEIKMIDRKFLYLR